MTEQQLKEMQDPEGYEDIVRSFEESKNLNIEVSKSK